MPTAPCPAVSFRTRSSVPVTAALVTTTVDRADLWAVQTPQLFRAEALRSVYSKPQAGGATDDAMLLERADLKVVVVPSTPANVKITTPADLPLAGALLSWEIEADV